MEVSLQVHVPTDVTPKRTQYPFHRRSDGPQNRSGLYGEDKNFLPLSEFEPRKVQSVK